ncbi:hypothetical protein DOY81_001160 [Sarcophaga bullata]|nr:hypothetical protein DOY81_001160 [Sarcophaga bullata]
MTLSFSEKGGKESTILNSIKWHRLYFRCGGLPTCGKKHHIVGALVDTCANRGWSINNCTMPVELSPLETRLLAEEVDIPCGHSGYHAAYLVNYSDSNDSLKYLVFRDLWRRGKYVTCGDAFGADFLLYPGDPLIYHASHIVILLNSSKIKALDMITKVRVSVTVNKLRVFTYLDDESDSEKNSVKKVIYHTMTWEGNRDKCRNKQQN